MSAPLLSQRESGGLISGNGGALGFRDELSKFFDDPFSEVQTQTSGICIVEEDDSEHPVKNGAQGVCGLVVIDHCGRRGFLLSLLRIFQVVYGKAVVKVD